MKKMQIPAVRAHFVMPAGKKRSGMAVGIDLLWSRQIVSVYAGIYECGSAAYLEGGVMMSLVIQKCTGENGKKTYREFDQILRETAKRRQAEILFP